MIKVLMDTCTLSGGYSDYGQFVLLKSNGMVNNPLLAIKIRENEDPYVIEQRKYLSAIAIAAKNSDILLYTYPELYFELMRSGRENLNEKTIFYIYHDIVFHILYSNIDKNLFFNNINWYTQDNTKELIKFLLSIEIEKIPYKYKQMFNRIDLFKKICSKDVLGCDDDLHNDKKIRLAIDAFHLWISECANMNYFLTVDKKLLNKYSGAAKNNKIKLNCKLINPKSLLEDLNIQISNKYDKLEPGMIYSLSGMRLNV